MPWHLAKRCIEQTTLILYNSWVARSFSSSLPPSLALLIYFQSQVRAGGKKLLKLIKPPPIIPINYFMERPEITKGL